ncbi:ras-like protein RAS2 [Ptychodera flava]|uniref:ras-like protein RAS2 n=1 Tax=Ptychodera flava TaxID=63121 RepID=UPI003969F5BF
MLSRRATYRPYRRELAQDRLQVLQRGVSWIDELQFIVVLLGPKNVGKTSLTATFTKGRYHHLDLDPHEFIYETQELVDNEIAPLQIMDTRTGEESRLCLEDMATTLQVGEGFIIVYSITDRDSFEDAKRFQSLLHQVRKTKDVPIVLVGNKNDLTEEREVTIKEGRDLAFQIGCSFYEVSAHLGIDNVRKIFHDVVRQIRAVNDYKATLEKKRRHRMNSTKKFIHRYLLCNGLRAHHRDPFRDDW